MSSVPIFSKINESVIYNQLVSYFTHFNLLSPMQFGFRSGKSTSLALEHVIKYINEAFEDKTYVSLALCDLTKAFDCVVPELLFNKLRHYGIRDTCLKLFFSYFSERQQYVSAGSNNSSYTNVLYGVPQGSILGPFLFIIMINDLAYYLPEAPILYADDTTLTVKHDNSENFNLLVSEHLTIAKNWSRVNSFLLNENTTQIMNFGLKDIDSLQFVNLLGFHLDKELLGNAILTEYLIKYRE